MWINGKDSILSVRDSGKYSDCLLYTSDAADEDSPV